MALSGCEGAGKTTWGWTGEESLVGCIEPGHSEEGNEELSTQRGG